MLKVSVEVLNEALKVAEEEEGKKPLTDKQIAYLANKGFSPEFCAKLTRKELNDRFKPINESRTILISAIIAETGAVYNDKLYALEYNNEKFFLGKIPEEFAPGLTINDLVKIIDKENITEMLQTHLGTFFPKKETFENLIRLGMSYDMNEGIEYARFNMSVNTYKQERYKLSNEIKFIRNIIENKSYRELYFEGLIDELEDETSRSAAREEAIKEMNRMDEERYILTYLSNTVERMIAKVNPHYDMPLYRLYLPEQFVLQTVYSLEEIASLVKELINEPYEGSDGTMKKMGGWTRILFFQHYADEGLIDKKTVQYLANVNDYVYDSFLENRK